MKKIAAMFAAVLLLAGCGGSAETTTAAETTAAAQVETTASEEQGAAAFEVNGVQIPMHAEAAPILEKLGKEKSYFESASCAFEGLDKEYTYSGFVLTTYPDGDVDRVSGINLQDDTVETPEGICIGSTQEDVEKAYGALTGGSGKYNFGDWQLIILLDSGSVTSIQYAIVTE